MTTDAITKTNVNQLHEGYSLKDSFSPVDATAIEAGRTRGATVKFSPKGKVVATLGFDTSLHVFDLPNRKKIYSQYATKPTHVGENRAIAFHPSEPFILADYNDNLSLVNYSSGQVQTFANVTTGGDDWSNAFTNNGLFWACQKSSKQIAVYQSSTRTEQYTFTGHSSIICGLSFSPNNELLATAGHYISSGRIDETVRIWDLHSGQQRNALKSGSKYMPMAIGFSPNSKILAVSYFVDTIGEIHLFDSLSDQRMQVLQGHSRPVDYLLFSKDNKRLATASWDGSICLWDTITGREIHRWDDHQGLIIGLMFNSDESLLISGIREEGIIFYEPENGKIISKLHVSDLLNFDISPDEQLLAIGTWDGVTIWQV